MRIEGYVVGRTETSKAFRFTLLAIDGESESADTVWLPKSLCSEIVRSEDDDFGLIVTATVPTWFVQKALDTRPGWQRAGMRSAPMATRPW